MNLVALRELRVRTCLRRQIMSALQNINIIYPFRRNLFPLGTLPKQKKPTHQNYYLPVAIDKSVHIQLRKHPIIQFISASYTALPQLAQNLPDPTIA